jgi:hypothetical protein
MAEEPTTPPEGGAAVDDKPKGETEQTVPYERFQQANAKAKEAAAKATTLEKDMQELRSAMEERENAGLPELERERKRAEQLEKRIADAEARAEAADAKLARSSKASWVRSAAKDFTDPDDAVAFIDLDSVEDEKDAERAVKALAKSKKHLLKAEEPVLPGRVLKDGQPAANGAASKGINLTEEAQMISDNLAKFLKNRQTA